MPSNINPANPVYGRPTTQSVRNNFQYAHDEITALQAYQATVGNGPFALKAGDTFTGPVLLGHTPPTVANEAASKSYVDARAGTVQSVTAGTGLTGGSITTTGTIAVNFGTAVGTVAQGNDGRFANIASPATAAPPMDGAAAIGSSPNYARQDHRHPTDTTRVNKAGDTMTGNLVVPYLQSTGDIRATNIYIDGNIGIQYAGSNWIRFGWNGNLNVYIDGGYNFDVASTGWVNNNFATSGWVNNNFATFSWVQNNFQANGSHYISNQNVDNGSSPTFSYLNCTWIYTHGVSNNAWGFWNGNNSYVYLRQDGTWDYGGIPYAGGSDARLKRNIEPTEISSLAIVNQFELVRFHWRDDMPNLPKGLTSIGFTTQQLQTIFPEAVIPRPAVIPPYVDMNGNPIDGEFFDNINANVMLALFAGCIQQLTKRLEQLESKL